MKARQQINKIYAFMCISLLLLTGCATAPQPDHSFAPMQPVMPPIHPKQDGGIYRMGQGVALFEDPKGHRIGDILTVVLMEETNASKQASTSTQKDSDVDIANPVLFGAPVTFNSPGKKDFDMSLDAQIDASRSFSGQGDSSQSNSLTGSISVTITEVWPNGILVIRGQKLITINQGNEYIQISGIVRPVDVRPNNTVLSTHVADARITYTGTGMVADSNSMGWFSRVFNSKWWPF